MKKQNPTVTITSKTRQQIANEYGFSARTLKRHLQRQNITISKGLLLPNEIIKIYQNLGVPRNG